MIDSALFTAMAAFDVAATTSSPAAIVAVTIDSNFVVLMF
jgi:hypothetical protein